MSRLLSTLAIVWRIAIPYFRSEDRWAGRALLGAVVLIELSIVGITVLLNQWNNRFYTALQERNWDNFVSELLYFCVLVAIFIVLAVYQLYLNQWLQIRWRQFMTARYLSGWLDGGNHYRMQVLGDAADNPDQRISDDVKMFVESTLTIGIGFLSSIVTLGSFVAILWSLSNQAPLTLFGVNVPVPGYLVWIALIYAVLGTLITHWIGRPLIALNFYQQRYEADFRFNLVRVRENGEQIALLKGEDTERQRLLDRFGFVVENWLAIMKRQKKLTSFTAGYGQVSSIIPLIVVSPAYFANVVQLGVLTQTADAFGNVQSALSFFVSSYRQIADWRAVVERLDGFEASVAIGQRVATAEPVVQVTRKDEPAISIEKLDLRLPNHQPLMRTADIAIAPQDQILVSGPSGSGKSTLLRAISGIWPFGSGTVSVPADAKVMVLPQRPYLPIGSLRAAIAYPALPEVFDADKVREAIVAAGLPALADRLSEEAHWNRMLSLGEQQRLGIARALLHAPDYLFLDEATASLDEPAEAKLYTLLKSRLPKTAIISVGHRSTLTAFHDRQLELEKKDGNVTVQETKLTTALR